MKSHGLLLELPPPPTSFSSLWKCFPSLTVWQLACGLPWLQTLSCSCLLIPNKPIFDGEITSSLFVSGKHFCGPYRDQRRPLEAGEQASVVPTSESIELTAVITNPEVWSYVFLLDPRSRPLHLKISGLYLGSILKFHLFCLRPCSICEELFDTSVWFWDWTVSTETGWEGFGSFLWEQGLFHWNCATSASGPFIWKRDYSMATGREAFSLASTGPSCSLRTGWYQACSYLSYKLFELSYLSCKLFKLFENYSFTLEKNLGEMRSQLSKHFEGAPTGTLANFVFKNCGPSSCIFLPKRTHLIKGNLQYQWPLWGTFEIPKLNFFKPNWITIALKFPELNGMPISIGILSLPNIIRNLKLPLWKIRF